MKIMLLLGLVIMMSGCGRFERWVANWTGNSEICVDGVKYIQFTSGASVKYNKDGTIQTCGLFQ